MTTEDVLFAGFILMDPNEFFSSSPGRVLRALKGYWAFMPNPLPPTIEQSHLYYLGTTSGTDIKVVGCREGKVTTKHPIALLARTRMPEFVCQDCSRPAEWLCVECIYEEDKSGYLCGEHMEEHPHENYGDPISLVNSPRTGMCGYEGPAEPP